MHIDARTLPDGSLIEGDICIVGAGAAGISMALDWANSPYTVVLLEGGGFDYEDDVQELYRGTTSGQRYYPLKSTRLHYFGGTTGHWAGMCSPFDPVDFAARDWVPHSGWPIKRQELDPYYMRANAKVKIGPYPYDFGFWREKLQGLEPSPWTRAWCGTRCGSSARRGSGRSTGRRSSRHATSDSTRTQTPWTSAPTMV